MKKALFAGALAVMTVALGCATRTGNRNDARIAPDIPRISTQADNVLDYVEGRTGAPKDITSPPVAEIADRMRQRNPEIARLKQAGCLGESNRGYVELRDCDETANPEKRNAAQKLLSEENKDRKALYNETAGLSNNQGVRVSTMESIHAMERLRRAAPGDLFQLPPVGAGFDTVKQSTSGRRLGAKCVAGGWVTMP
jgi:uncharacterized protein YdbL (DUF1318 family)